MFQITRNPLRWSGWACLALAAALSAQTPESDLLPGVDDDWSRYASPNFELISDEPEREARAILYDLELLRAVFLGESGERERERLPVSVYAFRRGRDFDFYAHHRDDSDNRLAGLYLQNPDRAVILLRPMEDRSSARRVAFHEYVHHMFRAIGERPPLWFNEGMAELLGGLRLERGELTIGHPLTGRLMALQNETLLPLEDLFEVDRNSKYYTARDHTGLFYAQSWALLHYLRFGKNKLDPEQVKRFLNTAGDERRLAGTNIKSLFEDCFKMDYDRMERDLTRYVRRGKYTYGKVPLPPIPGPESYQRERLDTAAVQVYLGEVALRVSGSAAGTLALLQAGNQSPGNPRVYEALGADAWKNEDFEKGMEYWERARELGSTNSAILRTLARREWNKWLEHVQPQVRLSQDTAQHLRALLVAAIRAEPTMDEAYEMLIWVEAVAPEPAKVTINAVMNYLPRMREKAKTVAALALCQVRLNQAEEAEKLLQLISRLQPDPWSLRRAEMILADLKGVPYDLISLDDTRGAERVGVQKLEQNVTRLSGVPVPVDL